MKGWERKLKRSSDIEMGDSWTSGLIHWQGREVAENRRSSSSKEDKEEPVI